MLRDRCYDVAAAESMGTRVVKVSVRWDKWRKPGSVKNPTGYSVRSSGGDVDLVLSALASCGGAGLMQISVCSPHRYKESFFCGRKSFTFQRYREEPADILTQSPFDINHGDRREIPAPAGSKSGAVALRPDLHYLFQRL